MSLFAFLVLAAIFIALIGLLMALAQVTLERDEARAALHRDRSMHNHPSNRNPQ